MAHDKTKVVLGSTLSSDRDVSQFDSSPLDFPAGLAVRKSSVAGELSLTSGELVGISAGKDLSDTNKTAVVRAGLGIPLKHPFEAASVTEQNLIFTAKDAGLEGNDISVVMSDTSALPVVTVADGTKHIAIAMCEGVSTAALIACCVNALPAAAALVLAAFETGCGAVAQDAAACQHLEGGGFSGAADAVVGAPVFIDCGTGIATSCATPDAIATGAIYREFYRWGLKEDGTVEGGYAIVDAPGGL